MKRGVNLTVMVLGAAGSRRGPCTDTDDGVVTV